MSAICKCSHQMRDHRALPLALYRRGACKVCLCDEYIKAKPAAVGAAVQ